MPNFNISQIGPISPAAAQIEIVERKGKGHPDTICDALAEELSLALCRYYRDQFGLILHHNVDKALLWGGSANPKFGGGEITQPMEIFLAGRASREFQGQSIPVDELLVETSRKWLRENIHALDVDRDVRLHSMVRPGSSDLVDLYQRQQKTGVAMANDTSCGVGFAPLTALEQLVLDIEKQLNAPAVKTSYPEIGEDIKVMAVRNGEAVSLTVACAFIDRFVASIADYRDKKAQVVSTVRNIAHAISASDAQVTVNAADGETPDAIYLTVSGTSAEAGDDGEVGRGNRYNGLITPYRPMTMEAVAGKNPVTHVGKLYNIVAQQIAESIVQQFPVVEHAQCFLVSRIGQPVHEPHVIDLRIQLAAGAELGAIYQALQQSVLQQLARIAAIQDQLLAGAIRVY